MTALKNYALLASAAQRLKSCGVVLIVAVLFSY